jgi:N-acyl-L-homoserine lactone synthetase
MVKEVFHYNFPEAKEFSSKEVEVTRFCISPKLTGNQARLISEKLMTSAFFIAHQNGYTRRLVGICFRPMLRIYRRANASPNSVHFGKVDKSLVLTKWTLGKGKLSEIFKENRQKTVVFQSTTQF